MGREISEAAEERSNGKPSDPLERMALALESMATDAEVTVEFGPPICPHCGKFDPDVATFESQSQGKLSEFVIIAECRHCNQRIYGVVESYSMHENRNSAIQEIQERAGRNADASRANS